MIVRDLGDAWQVVLQTDHADLSAGFAWAWAEPVSHSLALVSERHDDGWAVWEQAPRVNAEGAPVNFLDVDVRSHLAFYRAGIAAVTEQDEHAGLLLSMHGAGIYSERYGLDPGLGLTRAPEVRDEVNEFVAEQEAKFGGEPGEHRREYELLQLFDRLSLYFCMRDGDEAELQSYRLEPIAPWHVRLTPFPFKERPAVFSLTRRKIPKGSRVDVLSTAPEQIGITIEE
jgi:Protein of unknown function (DUF3891)